jgi:hypothetical protein
MMYPVRRKKDILRLPTALLLLPPQHMRHDLISGRAAPGLKKGKAETTGISVPVKFSSPASDWGHKRRQPFPVYYMMHRLVCNWLPVHFKSSTLLK